MEDKVNGGDDGWLTISEDTENELISAVVAGKHAVVVAGKHAEKIHV